MMSALPTPTAIRPRLPLLYRLAATARRALGSRGTQLVYQSPALVPLRRALGSSAPAGVSTVQVCGGALEGVSLTVDLSCEKYYWLGTHEEPVQRTLVEHVRRGDVVYDIGAHIGFFSLLCASLAGEQGRVFAFEPRADNLDRLRANVAANAVRNIEAHGVAIRDRAGEATFVLHGSSLQGHLADRPEADGVRVRTQSVDALVASGMPPPDILKIDVEGAEGRVIRGAARTIAHRRPAIVIEIHSDAAGAEVLAALPCAYAFRDVQTGVRAGDALPPGHYFGRAIIAREAAA